METLNTIREQSFALVSAGVVCLGSFLLLLRWGSVAVLRLPLVTTSRAYSPVAVHGFLLEVASLVARRL